MAREELLLINAFVKHGELTIHQLSKLAGKSYAFTNKYAHEFIKKGILKKKVIGSSILCALDYKNEELIASLVFLSMLRKAEFKPSEKTALLIEKYSKSGILVYYNQKISLISDDKQAKLQIPAIRELEFLSEIHSYDLSKIIVLCNHEQFWKLVARVMP